MDLELIQTPLSPCLEGYDDQIIWWQNHITLDTPCEQQYGKTA
ncbi:hypothetical protein VCHENC01_2726 [Vibrio harveyi]|jgi:hypothetical protein|nr:hypothetical protein VCHENC01_2726 [Vibrio harveyi]